jgi:MGT family glycosyltransferase
MSRFLIVTWDGAGNLVPTLSLARRLVRRGHDVRVLGHPSVQARYDDHGWRFIPFRHTAAHNSSTAREGAEDVAHIARNLWFGASIGRDVQKELAREPADAVIADCMLFGALCAGAATGVPTVALFHGAYALFRSGPLFEFLSGHSATLNAMRAQLGLSPVDANSDVHDACDLCLVATPRAFEPTELRPAENARFLGPLLDGPSPAITGEPVQFMPDGRPLVLVGFSTGQQGQTGVLQRVADGLSALDVQAVITTGSAIDPASIRTRQGISILRHMPHKQLLPDASLVVTHAGLGTVMAALSHGVPLLCMPMGRDQFFNSARVEALGAGRTISSKAGAGEIANTADALLGNDQVRSAARRAATVIAACGNSAEAAITELEELVRKPSSRSNSGAPSWITPITHAIPPQMLP